MRYCQEQQIGKKSGEGKNLFNLSCQTFQLPSLHLQAQNPCFKDKHRSSIPGTVKIQKKKKKKDKHRFTKGRKFPIVPGLHTPWECDHFPEHTAGIQKLSEHTEKVILYLQTHLSFPLKLNGRDVTSASSMQWDIPPISILDILPPCLSRDTAYWQLSSPLRFLQETHLSYYLIKIFSGPHTLLIVPTLLLLPCTDNPETVHAVVYFYT